MVSEQKLFSETVGESSLRSKIIIHVNQIKVGRYLCSEEGSFESFIICLLNSAVSMPKARYLSTYDAKIWAIYVRTSDTMQLVDQIFLIEIQFDYKMLEKSEIENCWDREKSMKSSTKCFCASNERTRSQTPG